MEPEFELIVIKVVSKVAQPIAFVGQGRHETQQCIVSGADPVELPARDRVSSRNVGRQKVKVQSTLRLT